jgi:hypothetical protein
MTALQTTISSILGLKTTNIALSNLEFDSSRRILLASLSITYTISLTSSVDINTLKSNLDTAVSNGNFASSLSNQSGMSGTDVQVQSSSISTVPTSGTNSNSKGKDVVINMSIDNNSSIIKLLK